ncbi:hypothetical protein [Demequina sp.]|uniref:hypothetical protein n=1 Tax=Demequina sp. TaxID=2050685 RepID=UPI0025B8A66A|nr:hypothetical protein [Demequina sp.]
MDTTENRLANIIDGLSGSPHQAVPANLSSSAETAERVAELLVAFGALQSDGPGRFRPTSDTASFFLRSVAAHIREGKTILGGWDRDRPETPGASGAPSGPALTYAMELARAANGESAPVRISEVVQVIIKANYRFGLGSRYLVRWDSRARAFQLVGGHRRPEDLDVTDAMWRELEEEVPGILTGRTTDQLAYHGNAVADQVSRTFGALSRYNMTFFTIRLASKKLRMSPVERWVSAPEITRGRTRKGESINILGLGKAFSNLEGHLADLPPSIDTPQWPRVGDLIRRGTVALLSLLGLLSALVTIYAFATR